MRDVDVSGFDLNLLVVLDALLHASSVTRAAATLGLTQPTVSHALARLREALGDPLLVRSGRGLTRTPRAEALAPGVRAALAEVRRVLTTEPTFDPRTSTRAFVFACPDLLAAFLPELLQQIAREAPRSRLETRPVPVDLAGRLADRSLDLGVVPARSGAMSDAGLVQRVLGVARWCVLARRGHPDVKKGALSEAAWLARPHVVVQTSEGAGTVARELASRDRSRHVGFVAPSSLAAMHAVAATDWFFAAPRELVLPLARGLGLVAAPPPVPLPPIRVALVWHERVSADPGHRFFRDLLARAIARGLRADPDAEVKRHKTPRAPLPHPR